MKLTYSLLLALATSLIVSTPEAFADGPLNGPVSGDSKVYPGQPVSFTIPMTAGQATVSIVGDGDTDVDVFIYDELGRLVASGVGPTDIETVRFFVPRAGNYRVELRNLGFVWNRTVLQVR